MPIILIAVLAAALPAVYLAATVDPRGNLSGMPVALVVQEQQSTGGGYADAVGDAVAASLGDAVTLLRMTSAELDSAMAEDRVAGAIVIPDTFDAGIMSLLPEGADPSVPTVRIATNAGDGGLSNGLVVSTVTPVLAEISGELGARITGTLTSEVTPEESTLLSEPFAIASGPYAELPSPSGLGTSAFYYALILVLLAFIGASLVNPLVDTSLGVIPGEVGPLVSRAPYTSVSRVRTFLVKAAILTTASPVAATILLGLAAWLGVTAPDPFMLWLFSAAVIAAIGTSALAIFAALGSGLGSLVNTLFFVALAMVSSGAIVPLEATPPFFQLVSWLAPFRHVVDGTRALLYFDGNMAAGLGEAWWSVLLGGVAGVALGVAVTSLYGRFRRFTRDPRPLAEPAAFDAVVAPPEGTAR
ncbi:YhgE/Pip domain-containing protein [Microbacterium sp. PA5]|uniref:YhgE/Pip domain-containing protein n=1 Tax=Microbacterium sp. PA5 TaxID=3416654 RepID=UPI003CEB05E1